MPSNEQVFLGVKEAAEYLGVDHKLVYRLVRDGQLPAARIGSVYRIKRSDLEGFLEQQTRVAGPARAQSCAACGRKMLSSLSVGGRCLKCGAPLCASCWQWENRRHCPVHEPVATSLATTSTKIGAGELLRCARCLRIISSPQAAGGACEAEDCQSLLCLDCWHQPAGHRCPAHATSTKEKLAAAQRLLDEGKISRLVTSVKARALEIAFVSRFDRKVCSVATIRNPISRRVLQVDNWETWRAAEDDVLVMLELLKVGYLEKALLSQTPVNLRSRYEVPGRKGEPGLVLEAVALSHLEEHLRQGFDATPASLEDLLAVLKTRMERADERKTAYLVGVASTTGWAVEAVNYVRADVRGRGFSHRLVLPCLVDLETNEMAYNTLDEQLASLVSLFSPQLPGEALEEVLIQIRTTLAVTSSVTAAQVAKTVGVDEDLVLKAFHKLADSGEFVVEQIKGFGLTIARS